MTDAHNNRYSVRFAMRHTVVSSLVKRSAWNALSFFFVLVTPFFTATPALLAQSAPETPQNVDSTDNAICDDNSGVTSSIRFTTHNGVPAALETSVVRYSGAFVDDKGVSHDVSVDLVGAIHIAESEYYAQLNALFKEYDVVVFELVSDTDDVAALMRERKEMKNRKDAGFNPLNAVSYMQEFTGKVLNLTEQIDGVDYTAENLRRGDCSSLELIEWLFSNGDVENFFYNMIAESFVENGAPGDIAGKLVAILCSSDKVLTAKRLFAISLAESAQDEFQTESAALENENAALPRENAIIHLRNKKALDAVRHELENGAEKIALFYGAGHLPDLGRRLEKDFGLTRSNDVRWLKAWNLERAQAE